MQRRSFSHDVAGVAQFHVAIKLRLDINVSGKSLEFIAGGDFGRELAVNAVVLKGHVRRRESLELQ
jgi:hypothetical protein